MSIASFKSKYITVAVIAAILVALAVASVMIFENRSQHSTLINTASSNARDRVVGELTLRARDLAAHLAESVADGVVQGDPELVRAEAQRFQRDETLLGVVVRNTGGEELYAWRRNSDIDGLITRSAIVPVRAQIQAMPGILTPQTVGELEVEIRSFETSPDTAASRAQYDALGRAQLRNALLLAGALGLVVLVAGLTLAWWAGRRVKQPIATLIKSADRIAQGDYSRQLETGRRDELGELQSALERMRQRLRQTTINKNYLTNVLGSMTDAVFVTSSEGVIRMANQAACKLLAYGEEELCGRAIVSILDERDRADFDMLRASQDTRETVVKTRHGQTIPVAITGSQITTDDPQYQGTIFVVRNVTERKRAERRIRYLARYDALTKVPNRMQFQHLLQQAIARALRNKTSLALLYLDMDRFKEINDTFGHAAGDRTLEILTERLTRSLPPETVIGRLAGDEFAMFVDDLAADADNRGTVAQLARTVLAEIGRAFQLQEHEVFLTASIGVAFCARDADNVIDLIRNADAAMYHSKQNGGNSFAFYSPEMNAAAVERLMLKSKLRRSLERDEFVVHYQPKVDLRDGRIVGAEALLRWRLPGHGDIPPSLFIPLAEETNLILEVGEWVLNRVCQDYRELQQTVTTPGRISLNLSLKQLRQASFILRFRSVFRKHGVSPTCFELEITETTLMADSKRTLHLLDELYAMGLHLSIDDFGTGYSSLSALQQFPIGTLKIDQSFVRDVDDDENDATIVRTVIEMGRNLKMNVIAEGVETLGHLLFLRQHHCGFGQGKLFGEPVSIEEMRLLLARQQETGPAFAGLIAQTSGVDKIAKPRGA
ncbi:MAG: sensor-containing diguanylate cyclase/phosphodiesterase [Steroidobacteraceae bacterium]|nr:sensor-containing diguanylate cyclase/phosphodiesterase [Steroidobacteraceae bacterium]